PIPAAFREGELVDLHVLDPMHPLQKRGLGLAARTEFGQCEIIFWSKSGTKLLGRLFVPALGDRKYNRKHNEQYDDTDADDDVRVRHVEIGEVHTWFSIP